MSVLIITVKVGSGSKVHLAGENSAVTFCNQYRNLHSARGAEATCQRCLESVQQRDHQDETN